MNKSIVLIGMPGSGKTTIGEFISKSLNVSFVDLDDYIKTQKKFDINQISDNIYLKEFRLLESISLHEINEYKVIALGGGTVLSEGIKEFLIDKIVIYLEVDIKELYLRIGSDRPLLKDSSLEKLYADRRELYENFSNYIINNKNIEDTSNKILKLISSEVYK